MKNSKKSVIFDFGGVISGGFTGGLIKGMDLVISDLSENHHIFIASSSYQKTIENLLKRHNLSGLISEIRGYECGLEKRIKILDILNEYKLEQQNSIMVTDTTGDIAEALAAGVASIGVSWGFEDKINLLKAHATAVVDTPSELLQQIKIFFKD